MRLVYYGTPTIAVPPLARLLADGRAPVSVVTRPDRPRDRGQRVGPSAVAEFARGHGLPVATPERASAPEEVARIRDLKPDLILLVAYGQILRRGLLGAPRLGALNLHFSLLPRHRGASPVQAALLAGDEETGVTTMWMTEGLDEGPIFLSEATPIGPREDAGALLSRLSGLGADLLSRTLDRIERGEIVRREQDPARASYAPKLEPSLSELGLDLDPVTFLRRVRALSPRPGSHLILRSGRLQILAAEAAGAAEAAAPAGEAPGTILGLDRAKGIRVALARGSVWLSRVRQSGRKETAGWDYANGARLKPGARLPVAAATA